MDPDNQPSTSKKFISKLRKNVPHANAMYPVTIEQFQNYTNVEEYLIKDMKRAGPNIYRINYKIRHKFIPIVYKKFYSSEAIRKQLFKNGFEIKPAPKFLKDKLMMMPTGIVESVTNVETSNHKNGHLSLAERIELLNSKKRSPKRIEKENCPTLQRKKNVVSPEKTTPKPDRLKNKPLNEEIRKITTFFSALKSSESKTLDLDGRKRKAGLMSTNAEPREKRLKSARPKSEAISRNVQKASEGKRKVQKKRTETQLDEIQSDQISDDASPNIQVMVKVAGPINAEPSSETKSPQLPVASKPIPKVESTTNHKTAKTTYRKNKRKGIDSRHRNRSVNTVYSSDDSDIKSNSQVNDDPASPNSDIVPVCEEVHLISEKSPLPRRNRIENFKDHSLSPQKKNVQNDEDAAMSLFNMSERRSPIFNRSSVADRIHGLEGVAAFEDSGVANNIEFTQEEFICIDRLEAIRKYPEKVRSYIKHMLRLEIPKTRGRAQPSSRTKVVSAFLQMSFEEYKYLINANSLLLDGPLPESDIVSLRKRYEAIVNKTKPWPKGVHVKLPTLIKFLQSKGILQAIPLQHIPPRILSFDDVLANTNLKEYISSRGEKPPGSFNRLLRLCKKEYRRCCEDGIWNEEIKFKNAANEEVINTESVGQLSVKLPDLGGEVNEGQSAVKPQDSLQLEKVANASALTPQTVEDKSEQPDTSKATTRQKKKKAQIISSYQSGQIIEDYLDAMCRDSDSESETTPCSAIVDHDYHATKATDIDKPRDSSIDRNTNAAVERVPADNLKEPQEVNIPTASETSLALKESEQLIETVNVPVEMAEPEILPAPPEESVAIIINDTPDSAGELLSGIIHPQPTENKIEVLIPPSPNLFQSSGESQINCTQSQDINAQSPESVYVPCNHTMSMTVNTEQNNLTMCIDPTSDSEDPFVETVNNQQDNIGTPLPSLDPGLVVKRELLSQNDASNEGCDNSPDDSVEIIEVHSPEPIVIADSQEMAQQLLDILTNQTTKPDGTMSSKAVNQSNLNNKHNEPLTAQAVTAHIGTSHNEERERVAEVSGSELPETKVFIPLPQIAEVSSQHIVPEGGVSDISDSVEFIEVPSPEPIVIDEEETAPELLDMLLSRPTKNPNSDRGQVNLNLNDPSFSCLDNFPQAQRFPSHFSFTQSQSIVHQCPNVPSSPQREEAEKVDQNKGSPQVGLDLSVVPTKGTNTSMNVTEEIPPSGSLASVSYVSIAPQNIPSDIDFIQSGSNDPLKKEYDHGVSKTARQISSQECEDESKNYIYVTLGCDVTVESSMADQPNVTSAMKCLCSEAEIPANAGSQRDVPEDRTRHVDSSNNTEEAAGCKQKQKNLNSFTHSNYDILKVLELPAYGEEDMSSAPVKGIELQNVDTAQVGDSNDVADKSNEGDLNELDENQNNSKKASTGNQLLEKPQLSCVSANQPMVDSEASDRQVSENCQDQYRNVESSEIIQQPHISLDTTTVSLTSADNSKIVDPVRTSSKENGKAPAENKQNQSMEVEDVDNCGRSVPSPIKDADGFTKNLPETNRSQDQRPEDKTKKVDLPKVVTNEFIEDLKEAVSSSKTEQSHLLDTAPVEPVEMSKVRSPRIATFENQFQNVRIFRGTYRRNVSKYDAPENGMAGANKHKARSSEHNKETAESQQTHIFADKSTISKDESRHRSDSQKVMLENSCDAGSFTDESADLVLSTATEASLPAEILTFGSEQIERMETNNKDVVPRNTIYAIESFCETGQSHVSSSDLSTSLNNSDLCNALKPPNETLPNKFSECDSKNAGDGPENTDSSATQKHPETALLPTGARILQELGEKDSHSDSLNVVNGIPCNMRVVFSTDCPEVTVETISNQHGSQATSRQHSGSNLESVTTVMDQSCSTEALQDSCHVAMEQSSQIPVSSTKNISKMMTPSSSHSTAKLQPTMDYFASKEGKPEVVNQITPNTVQQTESPIMPQAIEAPNTNQATDMTTSTTQKTYTFPALLPIGAISIDRPDEIIEGETVIDADEQDIVVPFLIKGRYLRSLPFNILSQKQVQLYWERSQILGIGVNFEIGLNENTMESVEEQAIIQNSKDTAVPADQTTENLKITDIRILAPPATKASQVCRISASEPVQSVHETDISPTNTVPEATVSSSTREMVRVGGESQISIQPTFTQPPSKQKPAPKTLKKKATTKASLKKTDPEFVPQKTHEFRSLPIGAIKKPLSSETPTTHVPPPTVEEIDFLIEDASQVIPTSTTASQILGTDCTYFESSQLLNNIEEHCAPQATTSKQPVQQQCHSGTKSKT